MIMKKLIQFRIIAAVALILSQTVQASLITGNIGFSGLANLNTDSAGTATAVTSWNTPLVFISAGTFGPPSPFAVANATPVTFAPGNWNLATTSPITNFWNVGGFKFELLSSYIAFQGVFPSGGVLAVYGTGVISGNGYTPTACSWSFTTQDPAIYNPTPEWSFSATVSSNNSNGAPVLVSKKTGSTTILSWNDPTFALQAAPAMSGTYTNIQIGRASCRERV